MARNSLGKGIDEESFGQGAGLAALLGDETRDSARVKEVPIAHIEPRSGQPRKVFDEEALAELAQSITEHGMIQPITVRETENGYYQIIAGERRWRAARMAGLYEVPVNIMDADDMKAAELALVENLQREDLNPVEEARGYKALMETYGVTQERAAQSVGKSRPVIANALRLLALPEDVLSLVETGTLTISHARLILELEDDSDRSLAARTAVERGLSVRETGALVKRIAAGDKPRKATPSRVSADGVDYFAEVEKDLTSRLGRRVKISSGTKKGKFEIEYYGAEDFEALYSALQAVKPGKGGAQDGD